MVKKPVPSLKGWLWEIAEKADALMSYYLASDFSQSYIYREKVSSLSYQIAIYGKRPERLETNVKSTLLSLFDKYFEKAEVEVSVNVPDETQPNVLDLSLEVTVFEEGVRYSVGREIQTMDGKLSKVIEVINQ